MSPPERRATLALALAVAMLAGCGKANLPSGVPAGAARIPAARSGRPARAPVPARVAVPLRLTAARASDFARAVNLRAVDVPGARPGPRSAESQEGRQEAAICSHGEALPVGGGRSAKLERGSGLEAESISSSVVVMPSVRAARADLAYADSRPGLACFTRVIRRKLERESSSTVAIGHVAVAPLTVGSGATRAMGLRIAAELSGVRSGLGLGLFVDVLGFDYGPAELELYATSFVQPTPTRTEEELLALMRARARRSRL